MSEQIKVSYSYKGTKISDNVRDILVEKLRVPYDKIERIEETTGITNLVMPRVKPFEAISWLSNYARPQSTGTVGADMLFFETKNGFNFRSLQSMYKSSVYATYRYDAKNIDDKIQSLQNKTTSILKYEIVKTYDIVNEINSGTLSNKLISLDPITRTFQVTNFNYSKYKNQSSSLNPGDVTNKLKNRFGKTETESYEGTLKMVVGNANQQNNEYIKNIDVDVKDVFMENNVPNRTAQLALANYTVIKASIPGDPGITAGRTVQFDIYSLKPSNNIRELDKFYSGKYLVTAVRHVIVAPSTYQTILELAKDSSATSYVKRDSDSAEAKEFSGFTDALNSVNKFLDIFK